MGNLFLLFIQFFKMVCSSEVEVLPVQSAVLSPASHRAMPDTSRSYADLTGDVGNPVYKYWIPGDGGGGGIRMSCSPHLSGNPRKAWGLLMKTSGKAFGDCSTDCVLN